MDGNVERDVEHTHHDHEALECLQVIHPQGLECIPPHPWPGKDQLDDDVAAEHVPEDDADGRGHRKQGVAEPVPEQHLTARHPHHPGRPHMLAFESLDHRRTNDLDDGRCQYETDRYGEWPRCGTFTYFYS